MKIFLRRFPISKLLAKTLRVNRIAMKSFSKICRSDSTLNCRSHHSHIKLTHSRRLQHEYSTSRRFVRLLVEQYEKARQSRRRAVVIQSVLREENFHVKRTVVVCSSTLHRSMEKVLLFTQRV